MIAGRVNILAFECLCVWKTLQKTLQLVFFDTIFKAVAYSHLAGEVSDLRVRNRVAYVVLGKNPVS